MAPLMKRLVGSPLACMLDGNTAKPFREMDVLVLDSGNLWHILSTHLSDPPKSSDGRSKRAVSRLSSMQKMVMMIPSRAQTAQQMKTKPVPQASHATEAGTPWSPKRTGWSQKCDKHVDFCVAPDYLCGNVSYSWNEDMLDDTRHVPKGSYSHESVSSRGIPKWPIRIVGAAFANKPMWTTSHNQQTYSAASKSRRSAAWTWTSRQLPPSFPWQRRNHSTMSALPEGRIQRAKWRSYYWVQSCWRNTSGDSWESNAKTMAVAPSALQGAKKNDSRKCKPGHVKP